MVQKAEENILEGRIGTTAHPGRNLLLGAVSVSVVGLVALFYWSAAKADASAIKELHGFRQTMLDKCKHEQFSRPASRQLESLYADSSRMQAVVHDQIASLQRQPVDCDHVMKALKSVDFPVE